MRTGRILAAAAALLSGGASRCPAFLGVGDAAFVTIVANPADDAHWVAELADLARQLAALQATVDHVAALQVYAGDPRAAAAGIGSLQPLLQSVAGLTAEGGTAGELAATWSGQTAGQQNAATVALLQQNGVDGTMQVFGQSQPRDLSRYAGFAADQTVSVQVRAQIGQEQAARSALAEALTAAWADFQRAQTESEKQAILTKLQHLQAQSQVLEARRRGLLDDLALADRQSRTAERVQAGAADESALAESSVLASAEAARVQAAQTQRLATLQKAPSATVPDYSSLKVWSTADAGAAP
jgi:hypothetical protein